MNLKISYKIGEKKLSLKGTITVINNLAIPPIPISI